ncbi:hypothetical protein D3C87_1888200 [compost metagenome]
MLLHLQWRTQFRRKKVDSFLGQDRRCIVLWFCASGQQPLNILSLAANNPVEGENFGPVADFLHRRSAQVIA